MNITANAELVEQIIDHARKALPEEACGLLVGRITAATRFMPLPNSLRSETAYEIDPVLLVRTLRSLRDSGDELVAIVHSHPQGPAAPSGRDRARAFYPEAAQLIVSLADPDHPQMRAYRIIDGEAYEIECQIVI